jgi:sialate O-acetylesterase
MNKSTLRLFSTFYAVFFTTVSLFAEIKLSAIFGDSMVLQRETNVAVWGTARGSATVAVFTSWNGSTYTTQALANGRWRLNVSTPVAGGPYVVTITDRSDNKTMTLDDVLIGEVWVCSGQSNMEMPMRGYLTQVPPQLVDGSDAAIAASNDPNLRLFTAPYVTGADGPQDTFRGQVRRTWSAAKPDKVAGFSATAYFFARTLRQRLNIPIGIVTAHWGGTRIEAWMSEGSLADINPFLDFVNPETETYPQPLKSSCLFNYLINPMVGYGIRGVLWYQGEANTGQSADYQKLLPAMIKDWRTKWGLGDFPFYYAQIAPFGSNTGANNGANLREAQLNVSNPTLTPNLPNIGMVCNLDVGEQASVHPAQKEIVSKRLANWAFSNIYGFPNINPVSPVLKTITATGNTARLSFDTFSDTTRLTSYGRTLANFEIAGINGVFYPATATISNRDITLTSTSVNKPISVRHGFKNFIVGDLFGTNGLPVSSFRASVPQVAIVSWNTSSQTQGGRSVANFAAGYLDANLSAPLALTRGSGVVVPTTASSDGYWGANDWSTTTATTGVAANKFFLLSLKAKSGKAVSYASIDKFNIRISGSGPIKYQIDYQIDNGTFNPCETVSLPSRPATSANYALGGIDLSDIQGLQNVPSNKTVTFRITPFEASSAGGSFLIGSGTANTEADLSFIGDFTDNVVPITLSNFQSKKGENKVVLTWETKSEVNFSQFILERSADGKTFYDLEKINASKQSNGSKYDYTDNTPDATTINYYRLKMVDFDGSFAYSKVLSESFDAADVPLLVYPSITEGNKIEVTFQKMSVSAQIKVVNIMGQLVQTHNLQAGATSKTIEIAAYTEGSYFLILENNGVIQSRKFVKQ